MIPVVFIEEWRNTAKWQTQAQTEQDLIISRALVNLYNEPLIKDTLVFRGGTALNKLFLKPAARYSEDLDFVQKNPEPIGDTIDAIKQQLNPWLGEPKRKLTERSVKLIYKYEAINQTPARLKIEINTTEHLQVLPIRTEMMHVNSQWYNDSAEIITYELDELMGTKLRALYQRRKGRDLFDLWHVSKHGLIDINKVIEIFGQYCMHNNTMITKDEFIKNLELKRNNENFHLDMNSLLPFDANWNFEEAYEHVIENIINKLP